MKNVLVLHGTYGNSNENWFLWLADELRQKGYRVWVPDLPHAESPSIPRWNTFIRKEWTFDKESIIVGHSSGAVAVLGVLQELPAKIKVHKAILVAGFTTDLDWDPLRELFSYRFHWDSIKKKANEFILFHSDDDPYVPLWHGKKLKKELHARLIFMKGQKHFSASTDPKYTTFPRLLKTITQR